MPLLIRQAKSTQDINECVELYARISKEHIIPFSIKKSEKALREMVIRKKFFRIGEVDGQIRSWILADVVSHLHIEEPLLQQLYYASDLTGIMAAKSVRYLHEELLYHAETLGIHLVVSQGSCYDENNIMAKILEKAGWTRAGHTAIRKLPNAGAET